MYYDNVYERHLHNNNVPDIHQLPGLKQGNAVYKKYYNNGIHYPRTTRPETI